MQYFSNWYLGQRCSDAVHTQWYTNVFSLARRLHSFNRNHNNIWISKNATMRRKIRYYNNNLFTHLSLYIFYSFHFVNFSWFCIVFYLFCVCLTQVRKLFLAKIYQALILYLYVQSYKTETTELRVIGRIVYITRYILFYTFFFLKNNFKMSSKLWRQFF